MDARLTPSKAMKAMCQASGCTKMARSGFSYCVKHGGGHKCTASGCKAPRQSHSKFCAKHGGGKKCAAFKCNKLARSGSKLCRSCSGGALECMSVSCHFKQRRKGLCEACYRKKYGVDDGEDGDNDDDNDRPMRWCTAFPALQSIMKTIKVPEVIETSLNRQIVKHLPRHILPMLACVSRSMRWTLKQLIKHPFNRGDYLVLTTPCHPEYIDKKPAARLAGHLKHMFIRVNKVYPGGREIRVQRVDYIIVKGNGDNDDNDDEVRPHIPKCKKRRMELADTETSKRVKRIASSKNARYSNMTTGEIHKKKNAFYVEYIKPDMKYVRIAPNAPPLRVKDIEARFGEASIGGC